MEPETNGYVGADGAWKTIASRYVGVSGQWRPEQYKWVGKNGYWRVVYYDTPPDTSQQFWIWSLDGWTANAGNQIQVFGQQLLSAQYPYPRTGAFYELEANFADTFGNYANAAGVGAAGFASVDDERGLHPINSSQYGVTNSNDNSGITALGLLGAGGTRSYGVSVWAYLAAADMPAGNDRKWLWFAGNRTVHIGVYIGGDGLVHWVHANNGPVATATSATPFAADQWNKIIVNRDGAVLASCRLYVNGSLAATLPSQVNPVSPANMPVYLAASATYAVTGTTPPVFSPERTISQFAITNSGRTVTKTATNNNFGTARTAATVAPGGGKYYFEAVWLTNPNANATVFIGVGEPTFNPADAVGVAGYAVNSVSRRFNHQTGGGTVFSGGTFTVNDVMGVLVDMTAGSMQLYKNGSLVATPFAAGTITTMVEAMVAIDRAGSIQCAFEQADWQYAQAGDVQAFPVANVYATSPVIEPSLNMYLKNAFFSPQYISDDNRAILTSKSALDIVLQNKADSSTITIPEVWRRQKADTVFSFIMPDTVPTGDYELYLRNPNSAISTIRLPLAVVPFAKATAAFVEDFSDLSAFHQRWYFLERAWGGANGGVTGKNARIEGGELILVAHGDAYTGDVQGVDGEGNPKFHTHPSDPLVGQPWTTRVGCCIVSQANYGYGSYRVQCKLPVQTGVASAFWTFHYEEIYPSDPRWQDFLDEGLHTQGDSTDGFYVTRNHEIDIELPSNLEGQPLNQVSLSHAKCNAWRGELQNWNVASTDPAYWEEYNAKLTDLGVDTGDDQYHEFRFDWYSDRVEYFIDGVLTQTQVNTAKGDIIPDIPGKFTVGLWFPSASGNSTGNPTWAQDSPWLPNPDLAWAGADANWEVQEMRIRSISFTPFTEPGERLIGETYPFGGLRATNGI